MWFWFFFTFVRWFAHLWLPGNRLPALLPWLFVSENILTSNSRCAVENDVSFFPHVAVTPDVSKKWAIMSLKAQRDCTLKITLSCFVSAGVSADTWGLFLEEPFQLKTEFDWFWLWPNWFHLIFFFLKTLEMFFDSYLILFFSGVIFCETKLTFGSFLFCELR